MVKKEEKYIPEKGDVILVTFFSVKGHEQRGRRPALVVSPRLYNEKAGLVLICPITSKKKSYPFEVEITKRKTKGVALTDQIRSIDYKARDVKFLEKVSQETISKVMQKISLILLEI